MEHFLPFFITLLAGLFFSVTFKKVQIPWVISLISAGVVIGPHGFGWFEMDQTLEFISQSGLVLMMFMAGLETRLSSFKKFKNQMYLLAAINGVVPLLVGVGLALMFGFNNITAMLIGIIFLSSSVAVVIPSLESTKLIHTSLGSAVLATSIVQDIASLVLLSIFLQTEQNIAQLPLIFFYPLVILILLVIRFALPRLQKMLFKRVINEDDAFQRDLRVVLLILFGMVLLFEVLGLHPIIAAFFTGLVLSESLQSEVLLGKIRAISYGIFIPTFFIAVGLKTDITILFGFREALILTVAIVVASISSKLISGTLGARLVGFNISQSLFFGATSVPQLSTTLAATFTGLEFGLITSEIATAMVALSVVSTLVGPLIMTALGRFVLSKKDVEKAH